MGIILLIVVGFIVGLIARALVPGKDKIGILATILLGIVGSFVGGALGALFTDSKILDFNTAGFFLSIIGAVIALLLYNRFAGGRTRHA